MELLRDGAIVSGSESQLASHLWEKCPTGCTAGEHIAWDQERQFYRVPCWKCRGWGWLATRVKERSNA